MKKIAATYQHWRTSLPKDRRDVMSASMPIYAFGRTDNSAQVADNMKLAGVIDDFADGQEWHGLPVVHGDKVPADALVISSILHRYPKSLARLETLVNKPRVMHYCDFERAGAKPLSRIAEARDVFFGQSDAMSKLFKRFDDLSKQVFHDVMLFRLTGDADFMAGYTMHEDDQYFDIPVHLPDHPSFVDGGAYDGANSKTFANLHPNHGTLHVFEPTASSMKMARTNLQNVKNVQFHACALGDREGAVSFDDSGGTSSMINAQGGSQIRVARLDDMVDTRVDFIKYDLEGYEPKALKGAVNIIARDHPVLAICVYHATKDFLDVPAVVDAVRKDYTIHLRHYTQGWNETVMYFIPDKGTR